MFRHLLETAHTTENRKKYAMIEGLRRKGLEPLIGRYAKNLSEDAAYDIERSLIQRWGRRDFEVGGLLTNICVDQRPPSNVGRKYTDEMRLKMSEVKRGDKNPMFGRPVSNQTRNLLSQALSGENNPFFGKSHSAESLKVMGEKSRAFHTGRKRTDDTRERMRQAQLGKTVSEETKSKISNTLLGTKQSEATKQKRAVAQTGRPRESLKYEWRITDPAGRVYTTRTFAGFCREHKLPTETLRKRENTGKSWKGWTVAKARNE